MASGGPYFTSYIPKLIQQGASAREAIRRFRSAGGQIGNEAGFRAYAEVAAGLAARSQVSLAPLGRRPGPDERTTWTTRSQKGYVYQVDVQVRLRGTSDVFSKPVSFRSSRLVTYGEALDGALSAFADEGDVYGEVVLGGTVVNVYEMVPGE